MPTSGNGWISYSCPIECWEYWEGEEKFAHEFSAKLRSEIALTLFDFRERRNEWEAEAGKAGKGKRLDSKQIKRGLKAAEKTGACSDPKLRDLIEMHCLGQPEKTLAEKAAYILREFAGKSDEFLMVSPQPKQLFTRVLYKLFQSDGLNVSLGSTGDRYAMTKEARDKDPLETAFIEFVRRCIWDGDRSVKFCDRIQALIKRCPICSEL